MAHATATPRISHPGQHRQQARRVCGGIARDGGAAETEIAKRIEAAHHGIPLTLAALKKAAEAH